MTESTVTVHPIKHFYGSKEGRHISPSDKPFEVEKTRAADLKRNGLVRFAGDDDAPGHAVRMLQHADGRPNDEPQPESSSPLPGTGVPEHVEHIPPVRQGETNPEPPAEGEIVSPSPGDGSVSASGPHMVVENPDSLVAHVPGFVERRTVAPEHPSIRPTPAAATPVREGTSAIPEKNAPRGTVKRRDR